MSKFTDHFASRRVGPWIPYDDWRTYFSDGWTPLVFDNTRCGQRDRLVNLTCKADADHEPTLTEIYSIYS